VSAGSACSGEALSGTGPVSIERHPARATLGAASPVETALYSVSAGSACSGEAGRTTM
jgi:hypothetical protein